ncbi:MAG: Gfo/Idh/MocA family oxidoreductase [Candidatus Margulisiibacteriota bacterium]
MMDPDKKIRTAVIGTGFMGSLHCRAYSMDKDCVFTGVFDADKKSSADQASKYNIKAFDSVQELLENVDAVSVAAPTTLHYEIGKACIEKGVHLLMEKPIAATIDEAKELEKALDKSGLVFAIGYIEKFNPAVKELFKAIKGEKILSFEALREAPPAPRANDVSVVLDLMIHDIDILLAATNYGSPELIKAEGRKTSRDVIEDASCAIAFKDGTKAFLRASKVSGKKLRTIRAVCSGILAEADLISKKLKITKDGTVSEIEASGLEPIRAEVSDFLKAVKGNGAPASDIRSACLSFETAKKIERLIEGR